MKPLARQEQIDLLRGRAELGGENLSKRALGR